MRPVGINGFGRIGKCVFLLLLRHRELRVAAINAPDLDVRTVEKYLKNDSVHKYNRDFTVVIIDDDNFKVNGNIVRIFRSRSPDALRWGHYSIEILIDATGAFLTQDRIKTHKTKYTIMTAPPKDHTPMFVYGANHETYRGEPHISNASCTTNCITPLLKFLNDQYGIIGANFTTIHASTASQKVVDTANSKNRTSRSIFNNIIPHTTGASSSIGKIIPALKDKIVGTSVRVPVNNVSLVDVIVQLRTLTTMEAIISNMDKCPHIQVCRENLVSSDYISTTCPSIVDKNASMSLGNNQFKFMVWYDNEWSYANQVIKSAEMIDEHERKDAFFVENIDVDEKNVVMRVDFNVPMKDDVVVSDFRIKSSLKTIKYVLEKGANRVVLMSHMGRPKGRDAQYSLKPLTRIVERYLGEKVCFLDEGLSTASLDTLNEMDSTQSCRVFLLENLRFHEEETAWSKGTLPADNDVYRTTTLLGNVYINDAFGSAHRDHLSITGFKYDVAAYGYLIQKELRALQMITKTSGDQKTLAIIGGGKMDDKLALLKSLSKKVDTIYIAGGNINSLLSSDMSDFIDEIKKNKAKIVLMEDGLAAKNLQEWPVQKSTESLEEGEWFYDIGTKSLNTLQGLIRDHPVVFWNGTLGLVEDEKYAQGSQLCVNMLQESMSHRADQKVIVGGGDTGGFVDKSPHTFTHISTGGGASIEFISFLTLVGLKRFTVNTPE